MGSIFQYLKTWFLNLFKTPAKKEIEASDAPEVFQEYPQVNEETSGLQEAFLKANVFFSQRSLQPRPIAAIDFSIPSNKPRLFVLEPGASQPSFGLLVSHGSGKGSTKNSILEAKYFSNKEGSYLSSLGLYRCGEVYNGKHGKSMRLDGLESTNSNARSRAIVMHSASYVTSTSAGRSQGCPAVSSANIGKLIELLHDGGLLIMFKGRP